MCRKMLSACDPRLPEHIAVKQCKVFWWRNDRHLSLFAADDHYDCFACGVHGNLVEALPDDLLAKPFQDRADRWELDQHLCAVFVGINQLAVSLIRSNAETKKSILLKIRAEKVSPREAYAKNSHMIYYPYERQLTELLRSFIGIFAPQSANIA